MFGLILAAQVFTYTLACDVKVNEGVLRAEIKAVDPSADISVEECINWSNGTQTPLVVTVTGVPDQYTRQQVKQFLTNHNPTETTEEERKRIYLERRDAQLQQLPSYQDLLTRIEALEAAP